MKFGTRWQRVTSMAALWAWKDKVWHDEDKKFTAEDLDETLYVVAYLGAVWSPQIALAVGMSATPLNVVEGAFLVGLGASFAIGGLEGAETYVDYVLDPVGIIKDPSKAEALVKASDIVLFPFQPLNIPTKIATKWAIENVPWDEVFRNRWRTGPYLPF